MPSYSIELLQNLSLERLDVKHNTCPHRHRLATCEATSPKNSLQNTL